MKIGDGLLIIGLLVWVSVAIGPGWIGIALFLGAWLVNYLTEGRT